MQRSLNNLNKYLEIVYYLSLYETDSIIKRIIKLTLCVKINKF